ncbi:hypothetical protein AVEN_230379-1 [Araneus ventricosus]|uniref:Uncharacterized protein n=1 Tax=Araneus ventricosus TaxID=182803 RepID=A0A4Y2LHF5_ARAVE|nr:hypothetical protein AVEN_230379-1 [Araneus ventricosus]
MSAVFNSGILCIFSDTKSKFRWLPNWCFLSDTQTVDQLCNSLFTNGLWEFTSLYGSEIHENSTFYHIYKFNVWYGPKNLMTGPATIGSEQCGEISINFDYTTLIVD